MNLTGIFDTSVAHDHNVDHMTKGAAQSAEACSRFRHSVGTHSC